MFVITCEFVHDSYSEMILSVALKSAIFGSGINSLQIYKEKEFQAEILELQTKQRFDQNQVYYWVRRGDIKEIENWMETQKNLEQPQKIEEMVDAAGANVVHLSYLFGHYKLGRWFIERYPKLGLTPYSGNIPEELVHTIPHYNTL